MFEFEAGYEPFPGEGLPLGLEDLFRDHGTCISALALLPWEEHCTECAVPECYASCDLYSPRKDGRCRRFVGGIRPVFGASNFQGYLTRITFKRWGQLMAYANAVMLPLPAAIFLERMFRTLDLLAARIPDERFSLLGRRGISSRLVRRLKHSTLALLRKVPSKRRPDSFYIEAFNPQADVVSLTLTIRNATPEGRKMPFQKLVELPPGLSRIQIPLCEYAALVDIDKEFHILLTPNPGADGAETTLYFGVLALVCDEVSRASSPSSDVPGSGTSEQHLSAVTHVKVLVWDLDNTLWKGILVEDGAERISLHAGIGEILHELDRRGILCSIASKNDFALAEEQLKRFGLSEYFLFPQIGWGPKGDMLRTIIADFNVGADTVAFLDDSPFEREQVKAANSAVRCYDAVEYRQLLGKPEFNPPLSADAPQRRVYYRNEDKRREASKSFSGEYDEFLKECRMCLDITRAALLQQGRIHELVTRTNQLNFSTNRYGMEEIKALISSSGHDCYCLECRDRFGDYGMVGFCIVDRERGLLSDLMLSCRVQGKKVEHCCLTFLLNRYRSMGFSEFLALYRRTARNQPAAAVFGEMGFSILKNEGNEFVYRFDLRNTIPDEHFVASVRWEGDLWKAA